MEGKYMTIDKLEKYSCFDDEDFRVVDVGVSRTVTRDNYVKTTITINALPDNLAHEMDEFKWRDGNLETQLEKAIDNANSNQSYETFTNFYELLKELN